MQTTDPLLQVNHITDSDRELAVEDRERLIESLKTHGALQYITTPEQWSWIQFAVDNAWDLGFHRAKGIKRSV